MRALLSITLFFCLSPALYAVDTVAVIPLFNLEESRTPAVDWVGESVAETIRESLSSAGILVLSREDREEIYHRLSLRKGVVLTKASVLKIGGALDAGQIIFGEFRVGDGSDTPSSPKSNLTLVAHTIDLRKFHEGPEFSQMGTLETLSQMETKLAWTLVHELAPLSAPSEEAFFRDRPPVRVDAMENYIRGLMATSPDQKMKLFTQAARIDDKFSQPAFQLGRMLFLKKDYKTAGQWLTKVTKADSHYLEATFLKGICRYYENDFDGAAEQFRNVAAEVPLNEVYNNLGAAQSRKSDTAALENFTKAMQGDETDPDYWFNIGYWLWKQGQFAQAADKFRSALDRAPGDNEATSFLGRCLKSDGPRTGDAKTEGRERIKTTFEDSAWRQLQAELKVH